MYELDLSASESGFELAYETESKSMLVEFSGQLEIKELIASFSAVIRHEYFYKNMPACYDFTNAIIDIDINSTEVIFHFVAGLRDKRGSEYSLAFVYDDEMTKALVDFYRLFFSRTSIDVDIFDNRSDAIQWIKEGYPIAEISQITDRIKE